MNANSNDRRHGDPADWLTAAALEPPKDLADYMVYVLMHDADPKERYRAARNVKTQLAAMAAQVQALSAKQLEMELGTLEEAAQALEVSRQYLDRLYRETNTRRLKEDRAEPPPEHAYGRFLAACRRAAELADGLMIYLNHERQAFTNPSGINDLHQAARTWIDGIAISNQQMAAQLEQRIVFSKAGAINWALANKRQLTPYEQGEVMLGYHDARRNLKEDGC